MKTQQMIQTFDQTKLFYRKDVPDAPRAVLVIVHGLCEHLGRYDYVTHQLNQQGIAVYRFDHRGHGQSEGKRVYYDTFDEIYQDVHTVVQIAKDENPTLPVFLLGHSMGGYAASLFVSHYPAMVKGVILSGALTRFNQSLGIDLPMDAPKDNYLPNALGSGVCSDAQVVQAYAQDPLVEKEISVSLFNSLYHGVHWLKANPDRFTDAALILHGSNDGLVSEKDSRDLFGEIASPDKTLKIYAHLFHEILNEPCKDDIIAEIVAWMDQRI